MKTNKSGRVERTALLIRCTVDQADTIREWARKEGRTLSGHVLKILLDRFWLEQRVHHEHVANLRDKGIELLRMERSKRDLGSS